MGPRTPPPRFHLRPESVLGQPVAARLQPARRLHRRRELPPNKAREPVEKGPSRRVAAEPAERDASIADGIAQQRGGRPGVAEGPLKPQAASAGREPVHLVRADHPAEECRLPGSAGGARGR